MIFVIYLIVFTLILSLLNQLERIKANLLISGENHEIVAANPKPAR